MTSEVAIIGAGIIGITTAITLLQNGFSVTVLTKDSPFSTNSDAAAATWYAPDSDKPILQKLCLESLPLFDDISKIPNSGVKRTSSVHYFKDEADFTQSVWASEALQKQLNITDKCPENITKIKYYQKIISINIPLIDTNIYRPYMLNKFINLGGKLEIKKINSLVSLIDLYNIIINCTGWESTYLTNDDDSVYPIRGQVEVAKINEDLIKKSRSFNMRDINTYLVYRPESKDCVIGTTYQENNAIKKANHIDKENIIKKVIPFFPEAKTLETTSKVGIRCGRPDVRLESHIIDHKSLLVHCYGHGGSGFSASWGSAVKVLEHCMLYTNH